MSNNDIMEDIANNAHRSKRVRIDTEEPAAAIPATIKSCNECRQQKVVFISARCGRPLISAKRRLTDNLPLSLNAMSSRSPSKRVQDADGWRYLARLTRTLRESQSESKLITWHQYEISHSKAFELVNTQKRNTRFVISSKSLQPRKPSLQHLLGRHHLGKTQGRFTLLLWPLSSRKGRNLEIYLLVESV